MRCAGGLGVSGLIATGGPAAARTCARSTHLSDPHEHLRSSWPPNNDELTIVESLRAHA
jgi:hypothetical protein